MANKEQEEGLKAGVDGWNRWRDENPREKIDLSEADLSKAVLSEANLIEADLCKADLSGADLSRACLIRADLRGAHLSSAHLSSTHLSWAHLSEADLFKADLNGADLSYASLNRADLRAADLGGADLRSASLNRADLSEANLNEAGLSFAHLSEADLSKADLVGADLSYAYLTGVDLQEANLAGANLSNADLSRANLISAGLGGAGFKGAKVEQTIFDYAKTGDTDFSDINIGRAKGLDKVHHHGGSTIGTNTLVLSKGRIPEIFLRGCGLNDWEIESAKLYNPELSASEVNEILYRMYDLRATQAIQINPLFISYSHADGGFVDAMEEILNKKGIRFWRDIHRATAGRLEKIIDLAIRQNPIMLLVLSENSVKSEWVEHEARKARELEKETGRDVLCPVALDEAWKDCRWPERLREQIMEYNIMDFSKWRDEEEFGKKFAKLVEGLDLFYRK